MLSDRVSDGAKLRLRRWAARVGVEVSGHAGSFSQHRATLLERHGIATILDVGAHVGQFAAQTRTAGFEGTIVSVEPSTTVFAALQRSARNDASWHPVQAAVGETAGTATLHLAANGQSSSLLSILDTHTWAAPRSVTTGHEQVPVHRLDELVAATDQARPPFMLKLDVQGFELAALRGAAQTLKQTRVVEVELSLVDLYADGSDWFEVVALLRDSGLHLCDVTRVFADRASGALLQLDGLFEAKGTSA